MRLRRIAREGRDGTLAILSIGGRLRESLKDWNNVVHQSLVVLRFSVCRCAVPTLATFIFERHCHLCLQHSSHSSHLQAAEELEEKYGISATVADARQAPNSII